MVGVELLPWGAEDRQRLHFARWCEIQHSTPGATAVASGGGMSPAHPAFLGDPDLLRRKPSSPLTCTHMGMEMEATRTQLQFPVEQLGVCCCSLHLAHVTPKLCPCSQPKSCQEVSSSLQGVDPASQGSGDTRENCLDLVHL